MNEACDETLFIARHTRFHGVRTSNAAWTCGTDLSDTSRNGGGRRRREIRA